MAYSNRQYVTTAEDRSQRRLMHQMLHERLETELDERVTLCIRIKHKCYKCLCKGNKKRFNASKWCEGMTH